MKLCTDPHGPLASDMLVGFDLIAVACETKFGGEPGFEALSADTPVQSGVEPPNPAGIPGRPPGHCPQVPDPETPPSQLARPTCAGGGGGSTVLAGDAQPADTIPPTAAMPQPVLLAALHAGGSWTVRLKPRKG